MERLRENMMSRAFGTELSGTTAENNVPVVAAENSTPVEKIQKRRSTLASRRSDRAAVKAAVAAAVAAEKVRSEKAMQGVLDSSTQMVERLATKAFELESVQRALSDTRLILAESEAQLVAAHDRHQLFIDRAACASSLRHAAHFTTSLHHAAQVAALTASLGARAASETALGAALAACQAQIGAKDESMRLFESVKERGERQLMDGEDRRSRDVELRYLEDDLNAARNDAAAAKEKAVRRRRAQTEGAAAAAAATRSSNAAPAAHAKSASTIDHLFFAAPSTPTPGKKRRARQRAMSLDSPPKALLVGFAKFPSPVERRARAASAAATKGWMPTGRFFAAGEGHRSTLSASWLGLSTLSASWLGAKSRPATPAYAAAFASPAKPAGMIPFSKRATAGMSLRVRNAPQRSISLPMCAFASASPAEEAASSAAAEEATSCASPPTSSSARHGRRRRHSAGSPSPSPAPARPRTRSTLTTSSAGAQLLAESALHCLATPAAWAAMPSTAPLRALLGETFVRMERASNNNDAADTMVPRWVPDDDAAAAECKGCASPFSLIVRRHHCRSCGDVFCNGCSSKRMSLAWESNARVCDMCATTAQRLSKA